MYNNNNKRELQNTQHTKIFAIGVPNIETNNYKNLEITMDFHCCFQLTYPLLLYARMCFFFFSGDS